jgi:hypothetical protein
VNLAAHARHLSTALKSLLGPPSEGAVAFLRCLPSAQLDALIDAPEFTVPGWSVFAVVDAAGARRVTADQAVELREEKQGAMLLLVDPMRAGAGLDGIYSAARELGEDEVLDSARQEARRKLSDRRLLDEAVKRAGRLGRRRWLTPWQVFDFHVAVESHGPGAALSRVGLWPVATDKTPDRETLELSAAMAERLLFAQGGRGIADRVRALLLDDPSGEQARNLEKFLHESAGRSLQETMAELRKREDLWLGNLQPRFSGALLRTIRLVPWRDARGKLLRWTGLAEAEEEGARPRLVLDRKAPPRDQARLVVRWTTEPDDLAKGSTEYRVAIVAGDDTLAEQVFPQKDRQPQQVAFDLEDFEELDDNAKFEVSVVVAPIGVEGVEAQHSEEFVLEFGQADSSAEAGTGRIVRTLVDGALAIETREEFDAAITDGHLPPRASEDKRGFIIWKGAKRSVRVLRPALIRRIEEDWQKREGAIGRWRQKVRADGSPSGALEFDPIEHDDADGAAWKRLGDTAARLAADLGPSGLLARIQGAKWTAGQNYVASFVTALESASPELALHGTVEVQSQSGETIGLIVLPLHPLRLAWHGLYDLVAAHARYEEAARHAPLVETLKALDSAHFPLALPAPAGSATRGFIFADVLGFQAVAMIPEGEREPKSAVALLSACLGSGQEAAAPSIGGKSAAILSREIRHYLECRDAAAGHRPDLLTISAWRPGDGATVARALGSVLDATAEKARDEDDEPTAPLCFTLDLFHPHGAGHASADASGRFLAEVARRRRSGGGVLEAGDRWMTEVAPRPGGIMLPRLRWSKRRDDALHAASHLSIAFDVFEPRLEVRAIESLGTARPLHAFGLCKTLERSVTLAGDPEWMVYAPPAPTGEKAPDKGAATDRLLRVDAAVAQATARALGGTRDCWPVLVTRLPDDARAWLDRLHAQSDWVVTVDRNACIEYFDAPNELPDVYGRFVIDAVPERAELGSLQLVTSTTNLDAVRDLVDRTLGEMGLSSSERNSRFLIAQLKSLSGRLAIRLASSGSQTGELIALALMHAHCAGSAGNSGMEEPWLDLARGFLLPVDEIADQEPVRGKGGNAEPARRADFIHVQVPARGPLEFRFVEVKHRLHLGTARQPELLLQMSQQTGLLRQRWHEWFFDSGRGVSERTIRRSRLAQTLHFYAARAARHRLRADAYRRLSAEIDQLALKDGYQPAELERPDRLYVFCPAHRAPAPEALHEPDTMRDVTAWLFGPALLPEERAADDQPDAATDQLLDSEEARPAEQRAAPPDHRARPDDMAEPDQAADPAAANSGTAEIVLGTAPGARDVAWHVSVRSNPHLLVVGLPGMGKTTALINLCRQFHEARITPIVFSFHEDIDDKLAQALGALHFVDYDGLGFNPLRIDSPQPRAHVDVAGTLRDIFGAIFPELGDLQLEDLRTAIKASYDSQGWGNVSADGPMPPVPEFAAFLAILRNRPKPNQNLLARLGELSDYGFFQAAGEHASLLQEPNPTIVRVHGSTNGILQNAFASFVLYSIYKDMFRRGVQSRLTHAIIFDEAHRAARLKLIPQLAKECRKFGLSLTLASQEAKDFNQALFSAVGNYLVLRVTEADARALSRMTSASDQEKRIADRLKSLDRYTALFFGEGRARPTTIALRG